MTTEFYKQIGSGYVPDQLARISKDKSILFYCCVLKPTEEDPMQSEVWRKDFDHTPTVEEVKEAIEAFINEQTRQEIIKGFEYEGVRIWLSEENQITFNNTVNVPVTYKVGEDEEGKPVYRTFEKQAELTAFKRAIGDHVSRCLSAGYAKKDSVNYEKIMEIEQKA